MGADLPSPGAVPTVCGRCGTTMTIWSDGSRHYDPSGVICSAAGHAWQKPPPPPLGLSMPKVCTRCGATRTRFPDGHRYTYPSPVPASCTMLGHDFQNPNHPDRLGGPPLQTPQRKAEDKAEQERIAAEWQRIRDELQANYKPEEP